MSLIVTAYTQEGIVIGADSCITTNFTQEGKELYKHSHCGNKLFLLNKKIGISTCGDAIINGILLSSLIDQYIWSKKEENITLLQVEIDLKNIVNNQAIFFGKRFWRQFRNIPTWYITMHSIKKCRIIIHFRRKINQKMSSLH